MNPTNLKSWTSLTISRFSTLLFATT